MFESALWGLASLIWMLALGAAGWLLADFGSGVIHWAQDRYGSPKWSLFGGVVRDTIRHHRRPRGFLKKPVWKRSWRVGLLAIVVFAVFTGFGAPLAFTLPLVTAIALSNEIHAAAHANASQNGPLISAIQRTGVIQSPLHHAAHHRALKNVNYCTVTNWVNPVLERFRFWRRLEVIIWLVSRNRPRRDPAVRRRQRRIWQRANT